MKSSSLSCSDKKETSMFVILGGNGKVGRATALALRARGDAVRVVIRDPAHADDFLQRGCDVAFADLSDATALEAALQGADTVQVICPPASPKEADPAGVMTAYIDVAIKVLARAQPRRILAISDYGAHVNARTGIPVIFHYMERQLRALPAALVLLRSAEHMQTWRRVVPVALATGTLYSMHGSPTRLLPMVSAHDVGKIAADVLASPDYAQGTHVLHAEGPRRYGTGDVARALGQVLGREIAVREVVRGESRHALIAAGVGEGFANLLSQVYEAHHAGHIDIEPGPSVVLRGTTTLDAALENLAMPENRA
jgi:uncharacterized protein YbjT (DUF2867 family)